MQPCAVRLAQDDALTKCTVVQNLTHSVMDSYSCAFLASSSILMLQHMQDDKDVKIGVKEGSSSRSSSSSSDLKAKLLGERRASGSDRYQ